MRTLLGALVALIGIATAVGASQSHGPLPVHADDPLPSAVPTIPGDPGTICNNTIARGSGVPTSDVVVCLPQASPK